jgi:hypothetical protein
MPGAREKTFDYSVFTLDLELTPGNTILIILKKENKK